MLDCRVPSGEEKGLQPPDDDVQGLWDQPSGCRSLSTVSSCWVRKCVDYFSASALNKGCIRHQPSLGLAQLQGLPAQLWPQ